MRGEIEVHVHSDDPRRFEPGSSVLLAGSLRRLTVRTSRRHGPRLVVSFHELPDRTAVEGLRGTDLLIEATDVRTLPDGQHWDHELVGCEVVTSSGQPVGRVDDVLHPPANDVLVVGEALIPLVRQIVTSVDTAAKRIVIDPIPGLLEPED